MFSTSTGIKQSFYSQTGDFQFGMNLIIPSLFGEINVGISGANPITNKINFSCNSGKILDNFGRFMGIYRAGEQFSLSGNISSGSYDYFINGIPESYNNLKNTGVFDYIYLQNPGGLTCQYDFFVNGEQPRVSVNILNCFSGDREGTGYIVNSKPQFPVKIYSGSFTNLSSNLPFSISGMFTGNLINSGAFYILPGITNSVGNYTGNLQLLTNGGTINLTTSINISGSPAAPNYSFNLIDTNNNLIIAGNSANYTSNVFCPSGSGIPIIVTLDYVSGSGTYYTNIDVLTGIISGVTGYILESGTLSKYYTGIGTGIGGQFNNTGSGFASGTLTAFQWATGNNFTWPYTLIISGYGSGENYSGIGSGFYNATITGDILDGSGSFFYNDYFVTNTTPIYSISGTGALIDGLGTGTQIVTVGNVTGYLTQYFTGSGTYTGLSTGDITGSGTIIDYIKDFTGLFNLKTGFGIAQTDYQSLGFYNAGKNKYFNNYPKWYVNSTSYITVEYNNPYDQERSVSLLTVSGLDFQTGIFFRITGSGTI